MVEESRQYIFFYAERQDLSGWYSLKSDYVVYSHGIIPLGKKSFHPHRIPALPLFIEGARSLYDFTPGGGRQGERLSEEDRAKGIILIAPDFLSSPLCDPRVRFLIRPPPPPVPRPHFAVQPRTASSKSFLRLIFPSNLHAAVIKGLGRGTSSGVLADATVKGVGFSARGADRPSSKQWRRVS